MAIDSLHIVLFAIPFNYGRSMDKRFLNCTHESICKLKTSLYRIHNIQEHIVKSQITLNIELISNVKIHIKILRFINI